MLALTLRLCVAASAMAAFVLLVAPLAADKAPAVAPTASLFDQLALLRDGHGAHDWLAPDREPSARR